MTALWAVFKRELWGYFCTPIAYIFLAVLSSEWAFYVLSGIVHHPSASRSDGVFSVPPVAVSVLDTSADDAFMGPKSGTPARLNCCSRCRSRQRRRSAPNFLPRGCSLRWRWRSRSDLAHRQLPRCPGQRGNYRQLHRQPVDGWRFFGDRRLPFFADLQPGDRVRHHLGGVFCVCDERLPSGIGCDRCDRAGIYDRRHPLVQLP